MKSLLLAVFVLGSLGPTPQFCMGAQMAVVMAAAQERHTPDGEWCQRPPVQSKKAHACMCHQHNCSDPDPDHVSAHTDGMCLNYCTVKNCKCAAMDCP